MANKRIHLRSMLERSCLLNSEKNRRNENSMNWDSLKCKFGNSANKFEKNGEKC